MVQDDLPPTIPGMPAPSGQPPASEGAETLLRPAAPGPPRLVPSPADLILEKEIARGGMGIIYQAHDRALNRTVAVKVLQERFDPHSIMAQRFVDEAQITGQLQHPAIPPIYQTGHLEDGRPFLTMKLIKGQTLDALVKSGAPINKLAIFEAIAQAAGYAHAHQVIHRDLKPANVMVGAFGEVQVMDWGLAKLISQETQPKGEQPADPEVEAASQTKLIDPRSGPGSSATQTGSILGTPAYMAPEQAAGETGKIDQRTDVFGLGAILCAMLTDQPPFTGPDPESVRLRAMRGQTEEAFARLDACGADPEVVALCKRCLSFHPEDRPADGHDVADEVARLRTQAEERARQAELSRMRAEVQAQERRKRRRVLILSGYVLILVLIAGLATSLWQMARAITAEQLARDERDQKEAQRQRADEVAQKESQARDQAEKRLGQIEKGVEIITGMLRNLSPRHEEPNGAPLSVRLRERAEKVADQLEGEALGDPLVMARLQTIVGNTLLDLGSPVKAAEVYEKARRIREQTLGMDHLETLVTLNNLAKAYLETGKLTEAIQLNERVRAGFEKLKGPDHADTLTVMNNLAQSYVATGRLTEALPLLEQVYQAFVRVMGEEDFETLTALSNLALAYQAAGQARKALPWFERVHDVFVQKWGVEHVHTLTAKNNLARVYQATGQLPKAIQLHEQVRDARVKILGDQHPETLVSFNNLATAYQDIGQHDKAIQLLQHVNQVEEKFFGADHPRTLNTLGNLAVAYKNAGRSEYALRLFEQVHQAKVNKMGRYHPDTLATLNNWAMACLQSRMSDDAVRLFEQVREGYEQALGPDHPETIEKLGNLGKAYCDAKEGAKAAAVLNLFIEGRRKRAKPDDPGFAGVLAQAAWELMQCDQDEAAEPWLRESLAIRQKVQPENWSTFNTASLLGGALLGQARHVSDEAKKAKLLAEAEPLLLKGYEGVKERANMLPAPLRQQRLSQAAARLIDLYTVLDKPEEVKRWQAEKDRLMK